MSEVKQEGTFKIQKAKGSTKKLDKPATVSKVQLKKESDAVQIQTTDESLLQPKQPEVGLQQMGEGNKEPEVITEGESKEEVKQEEPTVQIINEVPQEEIEAKEQEAIETIQQEIANPSPGITLPENVEKLVTFMSETGGTIEDYLRLNVDYSSIDSETLLKEYYKKTKPHLDNYEIEFLMDDNFAYDEDLDDERDIKKKKLAFKDEVAKARTFLDDLKSKYYDEIKTRPSVNKDQQKALDFFNRYSEEQKAAENKHAKFKSDTKNLFSQDFKGFDFNMGDKTFRYSVQNADAVAEKQSNINNLVGKFLDQDGGVKDVQGYHKAMYAAENIDSIAKHFYEQGKADAIKEVVAKSNNISTEARKVPTGDLFVNGLKVRAVDGVDSSKLRIQKKFNN